MTGQDAPAPKTVNVLNPYGEPENIDPAELGQAIKLGYKIASPDQVQAFHDQQDYGTGLGNTAGAFAAGAARGASFGLSDQALTKTGLVAPETLSKLKEYNPVASTTGEIAGVGAGLLAPELEGAGALLNPVRMVSKAGGAVTDAAAHAIGASEGAGLASKILSGAASHGLGSAVEGAAYGMGQSVSEQALGDPSLNGEKVLSNVGYSALFAGGLGAAFGAAAGAMGSKVPNPAAEMNAPAIAEGDLAATVQASGLSPAEKEEFQKGLAKLKGNASDIQAAGDALGAPVSPAQLSDNRFVRNTWDSLINGAPTMPGLRQAAVAKQGWDIAGQAVENAVGEGSELTKAELGNIFKDSIGKKIETEYEPIQNLYDTLGASTSAIPIEEASTKRIAGNIMKLADEHNLVKGTPEYQTLQNFSEALKSVDNLERLKNFRTTLSRNTSYENRFVSGLIKEKLDNLEESVVKRFARDQMKTPEAKEKILGLLDQMDQAKSSYKALRGKLEELGAQLGKKSIYGTRDFLDFFDGLTPEKVADRLFAKNNSEFMGFFEKNFPEEMSLMRKYRLGEMKDQAMKKGYFDPKAIFSQVEKLSPEMKAKLFTPEQLKTLEHAKTYLQSFPEKFNPSNTDNSQTLRHFFNGPTSAIMSNARDFAMEKFVQNAVKFDPESGQNISHLVKLERMVQNTSKTIKQGAQAVFKAGGAIAVPAAAVIATQKDFDKKQDHLATLNSDPEKLIDEMDQHTRAIFPVAPQHAGAIQQTAIRATQFLHSKLPALPAAKPFAPKFRPSHAEISQFNRYYAVVENPSSALDQVRAGTITPETMETLQAVYPRLLTEMQSQVMDAMTSHLAKNKDATLPAGKRLALSMFLGQDLDDALSQPALASTQMALTQMGGGQSGPQGPQGVRPTQKGLGAISQSSRLLTSGQSVSQRNEA